MRGSQKPREVLRADCYAERSVPVPRVVSVNVAQPRTTLWMGREISSSIWKEPVAGPHAVRGVNVDGDDQADRSVHGGPDKAVYAYALEDYEFFREQYGITV